MENLSSYSRWTKKNINASKILYTPNKENLNMVSQPKNGTLELSNEITYDSEYSLLIKTSTEINDESNRPVCGINIKVDQCDIKEYNRCSMWVYVKSVGFQNFYFHFSLGGIVHTESIIPNKWNHVFWEMDDHLEYVSNISITPFIMGCPPEALPNIEIYIGKVLVENVDPDYILGWELNDRIAYSHCGYYTQYNKIAITQVANDDTFYILNENNNIVYFNKIKEESYVLGTYYILDFSKFTNEGKYKIRIDNRITPLFNINDNPYLSSKINSLNFLHSLRCGEEVKGVHSACHLNCKTENGENSVPNFGGWHDAGDLSQFEICTAEMAYGILELYLNEENEDLKKQLLDEAKVGIKWLLQTRFKDGSRALAVSYSIWRNNEISAKNNMRKNVSEKGPFESFLSAAALALASYCYNDDPIFSSWCLRVAIEDFNYASEWYKQGIYTKRWGKNIDSQVSGQAIIAGIEIYKITKDKKYLEYAQNYANIVMSCQEQSLEMHIRGFFYEDPNHTYLLTYEHRGHEQTPIQGICKLLAVYRNELEEEQYIERESRLDKCINLYKEYVMKTINQTKPFNLLPAHIYIDGKINYSRFTIPAYQCTIEEGIKQLNDQIHSGKKIAEGIYLRTFPIAVQRRGFHATLLSKTKAISSIAKINNDQELYQIVVEQLEWILGKNPFASSTMYGEGNNYHPLYVAFSKQICGSLPVGIMTKGNLDLPYWPTYNNAVFKEIWGHTTGKYLSILADI